MKTFAAKTGPDLSPTIVARAGFQSRPFAPEAVAPVRPSLAGRPFACAPRRDVPEAGATSGRPSHTSGLPVSLSAALERLAGVRMDSVRVHYNSPEPSYMRARAYTQGLDIHLAPGQERLLSHEAWHAVQQMQGRVLPTGCVNGVLVNNAPALEREADSMGALAATGAVALGKAVVHDSVASRQRPSQSVPLQAFPGMEDGTTETQPSASTTQVDTLRRELQARLDSDIKAMRPLIGCMAVTDPARLYFERIVNKASVHLSDATDGTALNKTYKNLTDALERVRSDKSWDLAKALHKDEKKKARQGEAARKRREAEEEAQGERAKIEEEVQRERARIVGGHVEAYKQHVIKRVAEEEWKRGTRSGGNFNPLPEGYQGDVRDALKGALHNEPVEAAARKGFSTKDEQVRYYLTDSSKSGNLFVISGHVWVRKGNDWEDTRDTVFVLHVPS